MIVTAETPANNIPPVDAILVLGRGIENDGTLSDASMLRAEVAAHLIKQLHPYLSTVVFSGGHSWVQQSVGDLPPVSEGEAMFKHALNTLGSLPKGVTLGYEGGSTSTVANYVYSKPLIGVPRGQSYAALSDQLHFRNHRPEFIGKLVMPHSHMFSFEIPDITSPTEEQIAEERLVTKVTKLAMIGVTPGDDMAIMRRQRGIERANAMRQTFGERLDSLRQRRATA